MSDVDVLLSIIKPTNVKCAIGMFLISIHQGNLLDEKSFSIKKGLLQRKFYSFIKAHNLQEIADNDNEKFGSKLCQTGFLYRTPRGSKEFKISKGSFYTFRREILNQLDEYYIKNGISKLLEATSEGMTKAEIEIDPNSPEFQLTFIGGTRQVPNKNFSHTNTGCYVCQKDFPQLDAFEKHIEEHSSESDFKIAREEFKNLPEPSFKISFKYCKNSFYLCFTIEALEEEYVIDKIIIVRSRCMNFIRDTDVPFVIPKNGCDNFYIDFHMLRNGVEHPIIIIYHLGTYTESVVRFVEQHIIQVINEAPTCSIALKSARVPREELKRKACRKSQNYQPRVELINLQKTQFRNADLISLNEKFRMYLLEGNKLRKENFITILTLLLEMEDLAIINSYEKLTQYKRSINKFGNEFSVTLPESLLRNMEILSRFDEITLKLIEDPHSKKKEKPYKGSIHTIYGNKVYFTMYAGVKLPSPDKYYNITFKPLRLSILYQHYALEKLTGDVDLKSYLFPSVKLNINSVRLKLPLNIFNESINKNPEQYEAVQNISANTTNNLPYIIFGPPGTGKTSTVVESILQLWLKKETRILVLAGSNAACDEVAIRLLKVFSKIDPESYNLLRVVAGSVEQRADNIDPDLIEASNLCHGYHFYPCLESIYMYKVIVCTLSVAGRLRNSNIKKGHFTHIFIDECAASTECEALSGIVGIISKSSKLILSGDPKQLGPILMSKRAEELGMGVSLMERLMKNECYSGDTLLGDYDRSIQTKLVRNFRTHPMILELSNRLYYENSLIPCAPKELTHWALSWHQLPSKSFPIIFHSTKGTTIRQKSTTSLCNYKELRIVMNYVKDIMIFGINGRKIEQSDIGVISPYKKQYTLIREELDKRSWYEIETGAVETFQGKEKAIIIVSTVRSDTPDIGFLDNPRRLNVTLTRAQALLIIIGNPNTLAKSNDWRQVIEYCKENNCIAGEQFSMSKDLIRPCNSIESLPSVIKDVDNMNLNNDSNTLTKTEEEVKRNNDFNTDIVSYAENWLKTCKNQQLSDPGRNNEKNITNSFINQQCEQTNRIHQPIFENNNSNLPKCTSSSSENASGSNYSISNANKSAPSKVNLSSSNVLSILPSSRTNGEICRVKPIMKINSNHFTAEDQIAFNIYNDTIRYNNQSPIRNERQIKKEKCVIL